MYAVIRTGGKQYRVAPGNTLEVEKLEGKIGETITLGDVLLVANGGEVQIGQPTLADAVVLAKITGQYRGEKIRVFKYRPKKRIRVRKGHRQYLTRLQIESVNGVGVSVAAAVETPVQSSVEEAAENESTNEAVATENATAESNNE